MHVKIPIKLNLTTPELTAMVCKALSSEDRIQILRLLAQQAANISDIASTLGIPMSTMTMHIRLLEEAKLITVTPLPGSRGTQKRCGIAVSSVSIDMYESIESALSASTLLLEQEMPIGNYFDYQVTAPCGMMSSTTNLTPDDEPGYFSTPTRMEAQLIWLTSGYLEYRFSADAAYPFAADIDRIEFFLEICSETYSYNESWRSDVSVWINGQEIGIIECPGDHGGRRGRQNPDWWPDSATQFGDLSHITITNDECIINTQETSTHTLSTLGIGKCDYISFKLGVKPDARYVGGFNLFGEKFGDYPHAIVMQIYGRKQKSSGVPIYHTTN